MKKKIDNLLNDYLEEFKKYFTIFKRKIRKFIRKFKYRWNNPQSVVAGILISKIKIVYSKVSEVFLILKDYLLRSENRKQNLAALGTLIGVNTLSLAMLLTSTSYAIYQNQDEYSILGAKVGDIYTSEFDYTLLVYTEDENTFGEEDKNYNLASDIPSSGYTYSGYKCQYDSTLIYDEEAKTTSVTTNKKEICSIYFDLDVVTDTSDLNIKIMLEDSIGSDTYTDTSKIPYYGYKYSHYECQNNSELTYNSALHSVQLISPSKDSCIVYFKKESEDINITLYVEQNLGVKDYIESESIPPNKSYVLNESESSCTNNLNERVDDSLSYTDGYIEVSNSDVTSCVVYLDIENA